MSRPAAAVIVPRLPNLPDLACAPKGEPLPVLLERFAQIQLPARSLSTQANHARTRSLARGLPPHPTPGDIATWMQAMRAAGMAESTVALHRWNLEAVYNFSNACGWAHGNPVKLCPFTAPKPRPRAIARIAREWPRLVACASTPREAAFLGVLRFEGLRLAETLALESDAIDLSSNLLRVVAQREAASLEPKPITKTDRSRRELPIRRELRPMLRRVLAPARVWIGHGRQEQRETSLLFPFRQLELDRLRSRLAEVKPDAFGEGDAFHVFRHSFAVELRDRGKADEEISEWLGHASSITTTRYLSSLIGTRSRASMLAGLDVPERRTNRRAA